MPRILAVLLLVSTMTHEACAEPTDAIRGAVLECLETLIEKGTDRYGDEHSPLFMAVIDAETLTSPEQPMLLDSIVRLEDRIHRRGERGSNFWYDQALVRTLYRASAITGDEKYARAAEDATRYFLSRCTKPSDGKNVYSNGMPAWGTHVYWDCFQDQAGGDHEGRGPHEILVFHPEWQRLHEADPDAVRRMIEGIWRWHIVDKQTGLHNRHDDASKGCDFAFSGGSFVAAFAFLAHATGDDVWMDRAHLVADWHGKNRHPETGLVADCPGLSDRYDGRHSFTTVAGPHASLLLYAYELSGDRSFHTLAVEHIKAFDRYAWDEERKTYFAMLTLEGTRVPDRSKGAGYDAFAPYGPVNVWRTTIYSYEFTLTAAQSAIYAYRQSVSMNAPDPELLAIAQRWASVIENDLPPKTGRRWKDELYAALPEVRERDGAYAEDYGRAISFFDHLHRATGNESFRTRAIDLAQEALTKLFTNGIFRGHPAKPYYESTNGVSLLLSAVLDLANPSDDLRGAF